MIKEGGLENSGVADSKYGKAIFVSTAARLAFRKANEGLARMRNKSLNPIIAKLFSEASATKKFRPRKKEDGSVGEIREASGGKFISIIYPSHVSVIFVKAVPLVSAPTESIPLTTNLKKQIKKGASYRDFFTSHLYDRVANIYELDSKGIDTLVQHLLKFHDNNLQSLLKSLIKSHNKRSVEKLLTEIHHKELSTKPVYDTLSPSDGLAVPVGEPLYIVDVDLPLAIN